MEGFATVNGDDYDDQYANCTLSPAVVTPLNHSVTPSLDDDDVDSNLGL